MSLWQNYKLRKLRQRRRLRAFRLRRQLNFIQDNSHFIATRDVLLFATVRNESPRIDFFLDYYRKLGIGHFFFIDNGSTDDTLEKLYGLSDVSVYSTKSSYKRAHFGMDWINWLLYKHARGRWALTVDADEFFIYPHHDTRPISALTDWLDDCNQHALSTLMLDLYPKKPLENFRDWDGVNPFDVLTHFDVGNYSYKLNSTFTNLWIQGGMRSRVFFADAPALAPALNKTPLVKWQRRTVYISSTHSLLPRSLNANFATDRGERISGALLHTKPLLDLETKANDEALRAEHYASGREYKFYSENPILKLDFMHPGSRKFHDWEQLEKIGIISVGGWA